jgi:hypothetical protein
MSLFRWSRVAAVCLLVGGTGYILKYALLAALDPHGTVHSAALRTVTVVGLLLGELLLPIGVTGLPARHLAGGRRSLVALGFLVAIALFFLAAKALDAGFATLDGDPARLRTEGTLAVLGSAAVVTGLALLHRAKHTTAEVSPPTTGELSF